MVQSTTATTFRCDAPARTRFCAHFALVCLSCPSRRLLTSPSYRISGTPHAGATASDVAHTPAYIRGTNAAAIAAVGGLYGVAAAFFGDFAALEIMRRALHVCRVGWISAVGSPGRPPRGSGRPRPGQVVVCSCTGAIESMGEAWGEPRKASDRSICECVQLVEKTVVRIGSYLGCIVEYRSDLRCFGPPKLISFHVVCFILDYSTNQNHHTAVVTVGRRCACG
jgi:hypothetical protein